MVGTATEQQSGRKSREEQMEAIVAEHETALLRYATRILNNPYTAQDVVQNTFIKLFKHWQEGMKPSENLKGWLFRVTHNEAVDHIRRESRLRTLHEKHAEEERAACPDGQNCPGKNEDRKQLVLRYVRKLSDREQQVMILRLEEGLSYREISAITGRTEGNVGNILHHAVRKLSERLKEAGVA